MYFHTLFGVCKKGVNLCSGFFGVGVRGEEGTGTAVLQGRVFFFSFYVILTVHLEICV
jgi:hypothetical protein